MLFATYQPTDWKNKPRQYEYDNVKKMLGIPESKNIFWCIPAENFPQFFLNTVSASPWMPAKLLMFETDNFYTIDRIKWERYLNFPEQFPVTEDFMEVMFPDLAEYIVADLPEKILEIDLSAEPKTKCKRQTNPYDTSLEEIFLEFEAPDIFENYGKFVRKMEGYQLAFDSNIKTPHDFLKYQYHIFAFQYALSDFIWQYGQNLLQPDNPKEVQGFFHINKPEKETLTAENMFSQFWTALSEEKGQDIQKIGKEIQKMYQDIYSTFFSCNPYSEKFNEKVNPKMLCPCGSRKPYKKCCMSKPKMPDIPALMSEGFRPNRNMDISEIFRINPPEKAVYRITDTETMQVIHIGSTQYISSQTMKTALASIAYEKRQKGCILDRKHCVLDFYNGKMNKQRCIRHYFPAETSMNIVFSNFHEIEPLNAEEEKNWIPVISQQYGATDLLDGYGGMENILLMIEKLKKSGLMKQKYLELEQKIIKNRKAIQERQDNEMFHSVRILRDETHLYELNPDILPVLQELHYDFSKLVSRSYRKGAFCYSLPTEKNAVQFLLRVTEVSENQIFFLHPFCCAEEQKADYIMAFYEKIASLEKECFVMETMQIPNTESLTAAQKAMTDCYSPVYPTCIETESDFQKEGKKLTSFMFGDTENALYNYGGNVTIAKIIAQLKNSVYWKQIEAMDGYQEFLDFAKTYDLMNPYCSPVLVSSQESPDISDAVHEILVNIRISYLKLLEEVYSFRYSLKEKLNC